MLLPDERNVVQCLTQYGPLLRTQIERLLYDKPRSTFDKIIRNLLREYRVAPVPGRYLGLDPLHEPNDRMVLAVWMLLKYIEQIEPMAHYPADFPAQIYFLKNNVGYEIVVLGKDEEHLVYSLKPRKGLKYIFVLPDVSMVKKLRLPDAPCLFATVKNIGADEPKVTFYSGGSENG